MGGDVRRQDSVISGASRGQIVNKNLGKQTVDRHIGILEASHGKLHCKQTPDGLL